MGNEESQKNGREKRVAWRGEIAGQGQSGTKEGVSGGWCVRLDLLATGFVDVASPFWCWR